jgi:toxin FitB
VVSFVTVGELVKGTYLAGWGPRRRTQIADWLRDVMVVGYDFEVSDTWGGLAAAAMQRGRPRPSNDTWIAAVGLVRDGLVLSGGSQ